VPYSARGGTCSDTATKWRRDFVLRVLEEARLQCTTPEVFERLSETTKLRLVESAMLERCADRYSNFWQASCADLLHDAVGLVPSRRERSVMAISDDLSRSYNWLRRAARGLAACDLERFAMIIASECCQSWAKKHDQFRTQQVNAAAAWIAHSRHRPTICSYLERGNGMHNICCDDDSEFAALVAYADRSSTNGVSASSLDSLLERRLP
jgi:hypothetical protein